MYKKYNLEKQKKLKRDYIFTDIADTIYLNIILKTTKNAHNPPCNNLKFPGSGKTGSHNLKIPSDTPGVPAPVKRFR